MSDYYERILKMTPEERERMYENRARKNVAASKRAAEIGSVHDIVMRSLIADERVIRKAKKEYIARKNEDGETTAQRVSREGVEKRAAETPEEREIRLVIDRQTRARLSGKPVYVKPVKTEKKVRAPKTKASKEIYNERARLKRNTPEGKKKAIQQRLSFQEKRDKQQATWTPEERASWLEEKKRKASLKRIEGRANPSGWRLKRQEKK